MHEWEKFKVGKPSTQKNWTEPSCQPLDCIYHVTHIRTAARVLSDGLIKSGLVYDKSKLNKERIQVVWCCQSAIMGHFLNRTLWHNQAALTSSLRV